MRSFWSGIDNFADGHRVISLGVGGTLQGVIIMRERGYDDLNPDLIIRFSSFIPGTPLLRSCRAKEGIFSDRDTSRVSS